MTSFYDALSGEKRKLNLRQRTPSEDIPAAICEGSNGFWHDWKDRDDEQCKCSRCGVTVLFCRVQENIRVKGKV